MPVTFHPGRLAPVRTKPRLKLRPFVAAAAAPPPAVDWYSHVGDWPMFLNNELGDCTIAMVAHNVQSASTYGDGATETVTDNDVLSAYEAVSGYRPGDPSTDAGAVLQDVYAYWRKTGVGGHKALAFAEVEVSDQAEVKTAINTFGAVGLGIVVTEQMMSDFDAGRGWTRAGGRSLGGHAIVAVGYDAHGVWVVTWGQVIRMSWACFRRVVDEGWVAVLAEWVNDTSGLSPLGVDLFGLGEAMTALTGAPNPFRPGPSPGPAPVPVPPAPGPVVDPADVALADAMTTWRAAKGL